ncbi:MAG: hypothetical protein ACLQVF_38215, partial [Isosphaeraceae bacterium]
MDNHLHALVRLPAGSAFEKSPSAWGCDECPAWADAWRPDDGTGLGSAIFGHLTRKRFSRLILLPRGRQER